MLLQIGILALSIATLYWSAELVLEGAEGVGRWFRLSPLTIGLLLVGFGTSLPELFVGHLAVLRGNPQIALGNIIGSNLANLFLVMGVAGWIAPLPLQGSALKAQLGLHLGLSIILAGLYFTFGLSVWGTLLLLAFFGLYLRFSFVQMQDAAPEAETSPPKTLSVLALKLIFGLGLLYGSGEFLVSSGSALASMLGISSYVISVIFVALGTSLPELVTALVASLRGKDRQLITGNIIGSNIFNVAFVLGSLGLYGRPWEALLGGQDLTWEVLVIVAAALFLLSLHCLGKNFGGKASSIFLLAYAGMLVYWVN